MNWISKLERKFGRYAITNLTLLFIGSNALGYLLMYTAPALLAYLTLEPGLILRDRYWRLITWIVIPSGGKCPGCDHYAVLLLFHRNFYGTDLGNFSVQSLPVFRNSFHGDRSFYPVFYLWGRLWLWLVFQQLLSLSVYFSGICGQLSGYGGASVFRDPSEGQMACMAGCCLSGV